MKPKIFTLFTALTLSAGALFASNTAVGGIYYDFDDANLTATVTFSDAAYEYYTGDVVIPATVTYGGNTYSVTSIGEYAFEECSGLTSVTIPNSVTSIGYKAFSGCSGLTSVVWNAKNCADFSYNSAPFYYDSQITSFTFGSEVEHIPAYLCYGMENLTSVTIPNSVTSIGGSAFEDCSSLTSVTIPNSVTSIGRYAFDDCSGLTSVTIPNSVTSIGEYAFRGCSGLTSVTIPNSVTSIGDRAFSSVPNIVYSGTATGSPWGARSVNGYVEGYLVYESEAKTQLLACSSAATGEIIIPNSVTSIGEYAFSGCSGLTSVTIPNSVTSIGDQAFVYCSGLTSVTIPNSVTSIGEYAFYKCSSLTSVTIPNSVTSIGDYAFRGCSGLTSVVWNAKNCADFSYSSYSPDAPFYDIASQITSFTFGSEVEHIPAYLCYGMENLTSVTIPNSVMSIGEEAFYGCSGLTSVVWNAKNCADFSYSSYSPDAPFYDIASQITSFTFGSEVEHIPAYLCYGMENLTSVTIPNSVTSIGEEAFSGCSGLTSVVWNAKNCADFSYSNSAPFYDIASQITSFTFGSEVEHIPAYLCYGMENLTSVIIPNSVTSIGSYAFSGCSGLTSVTIPNSVTSIGEYAFGDCSGLTKTNYTGDIAGWCGINFGRWGSSPTTYSHNLYINDVEVKDLVIPNSVTSIGNYAFSGCSGLTSVTIPNSVTSIGNYAFDGCSGLTSITIPNSVTSIGYDAFWDCSGLTSVTIGNSVTSIGEEAFYGCTKLINIVCYAAEPPSCDASVFANYNVFLKVPCNNLTAYQTHVCWGSFKYISCIGSEEVQVTEFGVTPSTNEAQFTWPAEPNAATYELVISKDGVVFCTLTFNASGQLMGIAFAPSANTAATTATSGFQFTVTGLNEASHYTYTFDAKDAGGSVVKHYAGEFNTGGITVGLEQIELAGLYTQAGRIVCEGEFRIYDLLGRDVTRLNGSLCGVYVVKTANAAQKVIVK